MLRSMLFLAALLSASGAAARAEVKNEDIAAYNTALQAGDAGALKDAASRLASAVIGTPGHPDAALLAFEAAWTLCRIGACQDARPAAEFAAARKDAPATAPVLKAYVDWKSSPGRKTSRALNSALAAIESGMPSGLSVSAFREMYFKEMSDADWQEASGLAERARAHFAIGGAPFDQFRMEAELVRISSAFNYSPKPAQIRDVTHLVGEMRKLRTLNKQSRSSGGYPQWMNDTYWSAMAWQSAMEAYFSSTEAKLPSSAELAAIEDSYDEEFASEPASDADEKAPFCEGELVMKPEIRYPSSAGFRGRVGAVVLGYEFENGRVTNPEVLASVPLDGFRDEVIKAVSQWTFKPTEDPAVTGCRLDHSNIIQPFLFSIP